MESGGLTYLGLVVRQHIVMWEHVEEIVHSTIFRKQRKRKEKAGIPVVLWSAFSQGPNLFQLHSYILKLLPPPTNAKTWQPILYCMGFCGPWNTWTLHIIARFDDLWSRSFFPFNSRNTISWSCNKHLFRKYFCIRPYISFGKCSCELDMVIVCWQKQRSIFVDWIFVNSREW